MPLDLTSGGTSSILLKIKMTLQPLLTKIYSSSYEIVLPLLLGLTGEVRMKEIFLMNSLFGLFTKII